MNLDSGEKILKKCFILTLCTLSYYTRWWIIIYSKVELSHLSKHAYSEMHDEEMYTL